MIKKRINMKHIDKALGGKISPDKPRRGKIF